MTLFFFEHSKGNQHFFFFLPFAHRFKRPLPTSPSSSRRHFSGCFGVLPRTAGLFEIKAGLLSVQHLLGHRLRIFSPPTPHQKLTDYQSQAGIGSWSTRGDSCLLLVPPDIFVESLLSYDDISFFSLFFVLCSFFFYAFPKPQHYEKERFGVFGFFCVRHLRQRSSWISRPPAILPPSHVARPK